MLFENLRLALRGVAANKLRALLTMLGITIGVAAVIALLSVGEGVSRYITAQFESLGTNLAFVFPGQFTPGSGRSRTSVSPLTDGDAAALARGLPDTVSVVPLLRRTVTATAGNRNTTTALRAVTPAYAPARNFRIAEGRFLTDADLEDRARVAVIGQTTFDRLFPNSPDPRGQVVRVNGVPFRIVGLLARKGGTPFGDEDDTLMVPLTTAVNRLFVTRTPTGEVRLTLILLHFQSGQSTESAFRTERAFSIDALLFDARNILRERHRIAFGRDDDFTILSEQDLLDAFAQISGVITLFLGAIAGVSLLVGGVGIMNIMLVTVTERTREIGLRKAVGATKANILTQFLFEAILLAVAGGLVGVGAGIGGAQAIHRFVPQLDTSVTLDNVLLATSFAAAVGLFFGLYPATRAAGLNPIEALRHE